MPRTRNLLLAATLSLGLFTLIPIPFALAEQSPAADREKADADYKIQGEYVGEVTFNDDKVKLGAQIVAKGNGKFDSVVYLGGLPGDGWSRDDQKWTAKGERAGDAANFRGGENNDWTGKISGDAYTIINPEGKEVGTLKKVERKSPTLGAKPPEGAKVLFNGKTDLFDKAATEDGLLPQGCNSKEKFGAGTLHIEFMLPYEPTKGGQERGNSGVYLQGRYEVQVLDSFGLEGKNNECGGIYSIHEPTVNMCFPPLTWQTYDIDFTPAVYENGKKTKNATLTVRQNGVLIHENADVPNPTTAAPVKESADPGPLYLQDHGHPVRYRNIWWVEKK